MEKPLWQHPVLPVTKMSQANSFTQSTGNELEDPGHKRNRSPKTQWNMYRRAVERGIRRPPTLARTWNTKVQIAIQMAQCLFGPVAQILVSYVYYGRIISMDYLSKHLNHHGSRGPAPERVGIIGIEHVRAHYILRVAVDRYEQCVGKCLEQISEQQSVSWRLFHPVGTSSAPGSQIHTLPKVRVGH
jgi:hypothetical protein